MRKLIALAALLIAGTMGAAQADTVTVTRQLKDSPSLDTATVVTVTTTVKPGNCCCKCECKCNCCQATPEKPKAKPKPKPKPAPPPPVRKTYRQSDCFGFRVDSRGYPVGRSVDMEFYGRGSVNPDEVAVNRCTFAIDGRTGERLRVIRHCFGCGPGEVQMIEPDDVSEGTKPDFIFTVVQKNGKPGFPSGYGTISVDRETAMRVSLLFCFTARQWYGDTSRGWQYTSYYHMVLRDELRTDVSAHRREFHRTAVPNGVLGE